MRVIGTSAFGLRLPIIGPGDDLITHVVDAVQAAVTQLNTPLKSDDIVAITESMVAKAENNFCDIADIAADIRTKFPGGEVGLVFPMLSRNRFFNILKGIAAGCDKLHILLSYPHDEVGNPVMDPDQLDNVEDFFNLRLMQDYDTYVTADDFREVTGAYKMPFTGVDYVELYKSVAPHVHIYFSNDPRSILDITPHVLVGEIHSRHRTALRLRKANAQTVHTLCQILNAPVNNSGFNAEYGVLGSNLSTDTTLKLFPNDAPAFVEKLRTRLQQACGAAPEVLVYGDGAFKDPVCGIWELADPVVSPGHTPRLANTPTEIKMKMAADTAFAGLQGEEKREAITQMIKEKDDNPQAFREGTTPRVYADLLGSLADLVSGSGDKGTPVVLVRGYFDNYSNN
ncbi:MAG: coenzyme F420-0:L-glutamate ligase [Defluviitaleaceae bacterium]|nr:coenzyme F420-0:L-glutamate ligase [Defluviitaleaceae bacterium]